MKLKMLWPLACALAILGTLEVHAESAANRNPYLVLGVEKSATSDEINKAFRKLAMTLHPDVNPSEGAKAQFQELQWAHDLLKDQERRAAFDESGDIENETPDERLERLHREGKLDYFSAQAYSEMKWRKGRPTGNTYEDAKKAFEAQSYYASEEVGRYELTQDQMVELASIAAKNHGAVFSVHLMKNFKIEDPKRRFEIGMIAAKNNSWANVEFVVDAFQLDARPDLKFKLAKAALERSGYQIEFIPKWKFSKETAYELMKVAATRTRTHRPKFVELFEKIETSEAQRFELAKLIGVDNIEYLGENLAKFGFKNPALIEELAEYLSPRSSYVGKYVQSWGIKDRALLRKFAFLSMEAPGYFRAYEFLGKGHFELTDEDLRLIYYKHVRYRRKMSDPLEVLLESAGMPENSYFASITQEVNEYHVEKVRVWLAAYEKFAKKHPLLVPKDWLVIVRQSSALDPDVLVALLGAAYKMSDEKKYFPAVSAQHILCSYVGLPCESLDFAGQSPEAVNRTFNLLLSLGRDENEEPAFHGIRVERELLSSALPRFHELIEIIVVRGHFSSDQVWREWVKKLRVKTRGIRLANIEFLIQTTKAMFAKKENTCEDLLETDDGQEASAPPRALPAP